jgi:hypothetical protein
VRTGHQKLYEGAKVMPVDDTQTRGGAGAAGAAGAGPTGATGEGAGG